MQSQSIFVLLAFGTVAVTAAVRNDEAYLSDPANYPERVLDFQTKIDNICEKTYSGLGTIEEDLRRERRFTLTIMMKDVEGMLLLPGTASKSLAEFFGNDKNAKNIDACLQNQQLQFRTDLMEKFQNTTTCITKVSQEALDTIEKNRKVFAERSFPEKSVNYIMGSKWNSCLTSENSNCVNEKTTEINTRIKNAEKESLTTLKKCNTASKQGKKAIVQCIQSHEEDLVTMWDKHAKLIGECVQKSKNEA